MQNDVKKQKKLESRADETTGSETSGIEKINEIIKRLRHPKDGCPWDQIQTSKSLVKHTIEEAYEVAAAVENEEPQEICDELGDLLFNILFHVYIASEKHLFSLEDIIENTVDKMIKRHPHVFDKKRRATITGVNKQWEAIKRKEKKIGDFGRIKKEFAAIIPSIPALTYAVKVQKRAAAVGFDWDNELEIINKIYEEIDELITAEENNDTFSEFEEFGDVLFSVINLGRLKKIDPESALRAANKKFVKRFIAVEKILNHEGISIDKSNKFQMNEIWQKIKDRH